MKLRVLGPLRVTGGAGPTRRLGRLLLGVLALRPNTPLDTGWLIEALWPERAPRSAESNLRSYLAEVRRLLPGLLESGPAGYRLCVGADELDSLAFDREVELARGLTGAAAAAGYGRALAHWQGPVLDGLTIPAAVRIEAQALEDRRLDVTEDWYAARLEAGDDPGLVGELQTFAERHPFRERLWRSLMLAQHRAGLPADEVATFQRLERLLDNELGVPASPQTVELHGRILRGDPGLEPARESPVPRQLPAVGQRLVGREGALEQLTAALPGVAVISGMAGVGKTALAVNWALKADYPDGCLYVDLRGYGPGQPVDPAEALAGFLRAFGVTELPADVSELAARYRTELADRRVLVVLDNARDVHQVRPLLPGTGAVLVTSRDALAGLVARDGARRIDLDVLPIDDCLVLLQSVAADAVVDEPEAAVELAILCGRLPLALCVAAELVVSRRSLSGLVAELTDEHRRLDLLGAGGDQATAVRAVFSWSVRLLPEGPAAAFGLLGSHPAQDLALPAVAALLDIKPSLAADWLDVLRRAHLATVEGDRFGMHDLLRAYARDLTPPEQLSDALARLTDFYVHSASTAMNLLYPAERDARPEVGPGPGMQFVDATAAREWLSAEPAALVALAGQAADLTVAGEGPDAAGQLSRTVWRFLFVGGYTTEAVTLSGHARRSARAVGDLAGEASALAQLGANRYAIGDNLQARRLVEEALDLCRRAGDRKREGSYLLNLGLMCWMLGEPQTALEYQQEALAIHREVGSRTAEGHALGNLGLLYYVAGRHAEAVEMYQQALVINRQISDPYGEYVTLDSLGGVFLRLGLAQEALDHYDASLAICHALGSRPGEASAWRAQGVALTHLGRYDEAAEHLRRALDVFAATGHREHARALNDAGNLDRVRGELEQALQHHEAALELAQKSIDRYLVVEVLNDLALTLRAAGRHELAEERRTEARALATEIGARYELARANRISS